MLVERSVAERSEFYNDWRCSQELGAAVGAVLEKGTDVSVNIAVLRAARRGTITRAEHVFFERVAPTYGGHFAWTANWQPPGTVVEVLQHGKMIDRVGLPARP
jgi:hypothetical protein